MNCPKCDSKLNSTVCGNCGFSLKRDKLLQLTQDLEKYSEFLSEEKGSEHEQEEEKGNRSAADRVIAAINEIGTVDGTELCRERIRNARYMYSSLTVAQRVLVYNESELTAAEHGLNSLERAEQDHSQRQRNYWQIAVISALLVVGIAGLVLYRSGKIMNRSGEQKVVGADKQEDSVNSEIADSAEIITGALLSDSFFNEAKQGDTFFLGKYEQDNHPENGAEDIEWIVVENRDGKIKAMSKYCLDSRPYNDTETNEGTDWEHCTLRQWLNSDFYNGAFSEEEKDWIHSVNLQNPDASFFKLPGGYNTVDRVFLLCKEDIVSSYKDYGVSLFVVDRDGGEKAAFTISSKDEYEPLKASYTDYAKEEYIKAKMKSRPGSTEQNIREQYLEDEATYGSNACGWWLRTRADDLYSNLTIALTGGAAAIPSQSSAVGIRPAILVSGKSTDMKNESEKGNEASAEGGTMTIDSAVLDEIVSKKEKDSLSLNQIVCGHQLVHIVTEENEVFSINNGKVKVRDGWSNIGKIAVSQDIVVGLTKDGRVLISPEGKDLYGTELPLTGIADICICEQAVDSENENQKGCIICLSKDGTAYFSYAGGFGAYRGNVQSIAANYNKFAIVYKDGTVYGERYDDDNYADVMEWTDIVQIVCGETFVAGLKKDGTVVTSGGYLSLRLEGVKNRLLQDGDVAKTVRFDLSGWTDIVSIAAGENHLVGLRKDGSLVAAGLNTYGQCNMGELRGSDIASIEASVNTTIVHYTDGSCGFAGKDLTALMAGPNESYDSLMWYAY